MLRRLSFCTGLLAVLLSSQTMVGSAHGQNKGKGPAFTDPPKGDQDFPLLGEFLGAIKVSENKFETLALQLRAIGDGQFDALAYHGGLPGQQGHKPKTMKMVGVRNGDFLILSGGPWAVIVEKDHCLIVDREGSKLGHLDRVIRQSPTLGAMPPKGATVLFDGTNVDQFVGARMTEDGLLMEGTEIRPMFQDFNLHAEFRIPYMPIAQGQARGNSGLYLQSRYECQVLDSFGTEPLINGLGALYQLKKPDINMAFPPLVWQTYDIQFTAPRWASDGTKLRDCHITSWVNGVKVQNDVALPRKTGAGQQEAPLLLPIKIQNHGDPVRFRNIWIVDRGLATTSFPVMAPKKASKPVAAKEPAAPKENKKPAGEKKKPAAERKSPAETKAKPEKVTPEGERPAPGKPAQPVPAKEKEGGVKDVEAKSNSEETTQPAQAAAKEAAKN